MFRISVLVSALLLLTIGNCASGVMIQSDLDGEEIRGTEELISL